MRNLERTAPVSGIAVQPPESGRRVRLVKRIANLLGKTAKIGADYILGIMDISRAALDMEIETRVAALERAAEESPGYKR